jgi:hypothetical protein
MPTEDTATTLPSQDPRDVAPGTLSPAYYAVKARLDSGEAWGKTPLPQKLKLIVETCPAEQWYESPWKDTLRECWDDATQRGRIKAHFKNIGGNAWDLEKAMDDSAPSSAAALDQRRPVVTNMDTVTAEPMAWLWWPYLALGKLALLDGDPGVGKSLLTTQLAASLSRGSPPVGHRRHSCSPRKTAWPIPSGHGWTQQTRIAAESRS